MSSSSGSAQSSYRCSSSDEEYLVGDKPLEQLLEAKSPANLEVLTVC
jgi:hypothetical protein